MYMETIIFHIPLSGTNPPEKQWKITDEDRRNRKKWDLYEGAVNEMIQKTNATFAPWHILESNDKKYAKDQISPDRDECDPRRIQKIIDNGFPCDVSVHSHTLFQICLKPFFKHRIRGDTLLRDHLRSLLLL